ncbi:Serine/threonine protein phosphatase PrpC [Yoonia tamlensis]|uniref:Serine/threonine protein phosphatase PrpC n=1 Tax=Yoonia tamlensis TaxID=390270 RepID=A0A1I6FXG5_9RHOB|nr:protein phosphatase 2C domain-containing protein [Yoonia tamlensis]SFR34591.1 Serine/threonine protein phosphatase PrpC [Yoonia tamlensis]
MAENIDSLEVALCYDLATATHQGARAYQEDTLQAQKAEGENTCVAVVADGLGGHAAGDVASGIACAEVFRQITTQPAKIAAGQVAITDVLTQATQSANALVGAHAKAHDETYGMGTTLLATVIRDGALSWLSVGDSPLFLCRDGALQRLNADHSMAPQIDMLVKIGALSEQEGRDHPSRSTLASVIRGREIETVDCPENPTRICAGDVIIVSSDGLLYLPEHQICDILAQTRLQPAQATADALLAALETLDDPEQDNIAFAVIKCAQV